MDRERLQYLFERRYNASITDTEASELQAFLLADDNMELLEECISEYLNHPPDVPLPDDGVIENLLSRILQNKEEPPTIPKARRVPLYLKWAVAAMLLLSVGWTVWHFIDSKHYTEPTNIIARTPDVLPGHNGAVLTLADGSTVLLDSAANGIVAVQGNAKAVLKDQQLQYTTNGV